MAILKKKKNLIYVIEKEHFTHVDWISLKGPINISVNITMHLLNNL